MLCATADATHPICSLPLIRNVATLAQECWRIQIIKIKEVGILLFWVPDVAGWLLEERRQIRRSRGN